MRKFSVPYGNQEPESYLMMLDRFKDSIDSIYFSFPSIYEHVITKIVKENPIQAYNNTKQFLELTKGKYRRNLLLNSIFDSTSEPKKLHILTIIVPLILQYDIEECTVADYSLCKILHEFLPELKITASCNTYQYHKKQIDYWLETGATTINLPREVLRDFDLLKQLAKNRNFISKAIVNEGCLFGCPQSINHACYMTFDGTRQYTWICDTKESHDLLKTNFILPRWLKKFDQYIDVYKIVHRFFSTDHLSLILDQYINEKDDLTLRALISTRINGLDIDTKHVPDFLLKCKCSLCHTCKICENTVKKYGVPISVE